jgi:uncharacterized protein YcbX
VKGASVEVRGLFVYPIKSCRGIALQEGCLTPLGLQFDRQWMVVSETGRAVTQRDIPLLSQIATAIQGDELVLSRPGHGAITVPLSQTVAQSQGQAVHAKVWQDECDTVVASEAASRWLTQAVESSMPLKLVRMAPGFNRPQSNPELLGESTRIQFADAAPFLIIDEASLQLLNETLVSAGERPVPMNRFRPNIVVRGLEPFAERSLQQLACNAYQFVLRMPCERCVVPTIDQDTSLLHPQKEPFATLRKLNPLEPKRRQPVFGQYATLAAGAGGKIAVGDTLSAAHAV